MNSLWKRMHAQSNAMQRGARLWRRAKRAAVDKTLPVWNSLRRTKLLAAPSKPS
ncbi:MAG: hypothetical protein AAFQ82_01060 [Myxococcota bacterium]